LQDFAGGGGKILKQRSLSLDPIEKLLIVDAVAAPEMPAAPFAEPPAPARP